MEKPKPQPRAETLDYNECARYIEEKLGYKIRDVQGKFSGNPSALYLDWWHFLCNHRDIGNPCDITISNDLLDYGKPWQNEITQAFIDEFGEDAVYHVWW